MRLGRWFWRCCFRQWHSDGVVRPLAVLWNDVSNDHQCRAAQTDTGTQSGAEFTDTLTFPKLSTNAFLQATLTVSGSESLSGAGFVGISADVFLNGSSNCVIQVLKGACTTSLSVSPGDQVAIQGSLLADAVVGPTSGASTLVFNTKKAFGAQFAFVLVDSTGHKMNVPLVAASGTKYPTK